MASRIFVTHQLPELVEKRMGELFGYEPRGADTALDAAGIILRAKGANVLVPTLSDSINKDVIDGLSPHLKLIANFGAGVDHIDVAYAKKRGIVVTNTPGVLAEDTADIAMTLLLAVPRRLSEAMQDIRQQQWTGWSPLYMLGRRVNGKKLGIIGMGRIGQAVARRAKGFGMEIHYHQRTQLHDSVEQEFGASYHASLDTLLRTVDMVSLHCPHTKDTHHLMNAKRLKLMKPTAYLVNTTRGALIDEQSLIDALRNGTIAGAGLDVYEHAPDVPRELRNLPNVVLLPHISSATWESRIEMGERVIINIRSFLDGHNPPDKVLVEEAI